VPAQGAGRSSQLPVPASCVTLVRLAWLARLDARAAKWPLPIRLVYLGVKWYLVLAGAIIAIAYYFRLSGFAHLR